MKKRKTFFLLSAALLLLGVMPVKSQSDLFVYKTDAKLTVSLDQLQKLTFTEFGLVVNKTDGTATPVAFSDLYCISFLDNLYQYTGIGKVKTTDATSIWPDNGIVRVKSAQTITGVNIFGLQGQKLIQLQPQSQEINISLASYPAGVYLIQIADAKGITIKKIIKN